MNRKKPLLTISLLRHVSALLFKAGLACLPTLLFPLTFLVRVEEKNAVVFLIAALVLSTYSILVWVSHFKAKLFEVFKRN